ncbi:alpha/beta fold hydrolase [Sporichthya polymorpha]|uniref:alpha/beta fold hydrolase n=1 Tax=Sporichthya polymorpha TaxID=35751 RepID=UPI00036F753F|nr:alpha/beta hydrolase [Sporichthya polymorpha]
MPIPTSRARRWGATLRIALAGALTATAVAALGSSPATAAANGPAVVGSAVEIPVKFTVVNRNTTGIPCQTEPDGKTYTVHANLVAPRDLVRASSPAVTMYLHGLGYSSFFFHLTEVPEYDYALNQATQGHVSLVIDRLGNPAHDDLPDGMATCLPAQADIADQIADALRAGNYKAGGNVLPRFGRVILAGHSAGGLIAELTQAIFGSAEALAVIGYTHYPSTLALQTLFASGQDCLTAPQHARGDAGAPNYAPFGRTDAEFAAAHFHDVESAVAELVLRKRNRDACGDLLSATQGYLATNLMTPAINVPTLLILGTKDALFPPPGPEFQVQTAYPQAPRLSFVQLEATGHAITFGRTAEKFRSIMAQWLAENQA